MRNNYLSDKAPSHLTNAVSCGTRALSEVSKASLDRIRTPCFVYDENHLTESASNLSTVGKQVGCKVLFSLKSFAIVDALQLMAPMLNGFASSSIFEAVLARSIVKTTGTVHITTPSFRPDEVDNLAELCDYVSFNSLSQWIRFRPIVGSRARCGLRVNPQLSFVNDDRYNPCRKYSKLGVRWTL